ncbi:anthranilate synthase component I family protein [Sphingobacterium corticibacterium]|uniref:Anthranilate synthase component I family protein n=1 Tax=Sphingobacterium corticibacterium TaxID=2484746 RepID=A0A4Q6XWE4_9SPHI|nr:anthranilate synthase component I family protein [Sphingobacterium corticibacterium]RZF61704.1 anthranilate synthase component I family protein [Sphingobacterium corticibacterium]
MATAVFQVDTQQFERKALQWAQQFDEVCFFQSNGYSDEYAQIGNLLAVKAVDSFVSTQTDIFHTLEKFRAKHSDTWMPGFFSYDLKNEIEDLTTSFPNQLAFPEAYFFIPSIILDFKYKQVKIEALYPEKVYRDILAYDYIANEERIETEPIQFQKRMSKKAYLEVFRQLLKHIRQGDIYEVNLCQEFYTTHVTLSPLTVYQKLNQISPTPFSCFFKIKDKYILSASPERFLAKRGNTLISQPIKGTAPRGKSTEDDREIIATLKNSPKEIAENVMIVDLVRNDLTRSAQEGTVKAERQLEVQTFKQVHQLVSTITCQKRTDISDIEVIRNTFPAGSMTGAPKISAMKLCDRYENSKRGIYAGSVGYFDPAGNFDFNVVIRSLLYNSTKEYLSFHTGGAITIDADPEKEYQECLLKASAILKTLNANLVE